MPMVDLLDRIRRTVETIDGPLARSLDASVAGVHAAVAALVPVILGAVAQRGSDREGAARVLDWIRSDQIPELATAEAAADALRDEVGVNRIASVGPALAGMLFDKRLSSLAESIGVISHLPSSVVQRLVSIFVPIALGALKHHVIDGRLDAGSFAAELAGQRHLLQGALDRRLLGALGFQSIAAYLDPVGRASAPAAAPAPSARAAPSRQRTMLWWVLAIIVVALVIVTLRRGG